jgi:uncharacterized protein YgiM (DUF1202 family)
MARRFLLAAAAAVSLTLVSPLYALSPALAAPTAAEEQGITPDQAPNTKNAAIGEINANDVYVRSAAGENYYPTMKLTRGTKVTVVGEKFDWLKIVPPEGSFCYVAKAYVDKGAGETAKANRADVNVRAGSVLNTIKTTILGKLNEGQEVKVLGEVDEYYKIAPPPDAFVYVKKDAVKPVAAIAQVAGTPAAAKPPEELATSAKPATPAAPTGDTGAATPPDTTAGAATTQPAGETVASAATTQPSSDVAFDKLEEDFKAASDKPIEQQPIAELKASYEKLIANPQLPEWMRRTADFRTRTLKARADAKQQFLAVQKQQEEAKQRVQAMKAEQEEIKQQIAKNEVKLYTAVGTLRTSSLQTGNGGMLYRLTDPQTGRTVCYIRSDDPKYGGMLEKFVGVKGAVSTDPQLSLKVVTPTDVAEVDPNQLYRGVASQIVPPSLLPPAQTASNHE